MIRHILGELSLSISTFVYLFWLLPQIWHNFKRQSTLGLSQSLHAILFIGYCFDLIYGFGLHMQWQYRLVTILGLFGLCLQHLQIAWYSSIDQLQKNNFVLLTLFLFILLSFAIITVLFIKHSLPFYNMAGLIDSASSLTYILPQIWFNFRLRSTKGISILFVYLSIFIASCDFNSAICLNWNWPSLLGPLVGLFAHALIVLQIFFYKKNRFHLVFN